MEEICSWCHKYFDSDVKYKQCSPCRKQKREYLREWYAKHPNKQREYSKQYRSLHKEEDNVRSRSWRQTHPDYMKEYNKIYYEQHSEKFKLNARRWAQRNPTRRSVISVRHNHKRRALKAIGGSYTTEELLGLVNEQNGCCFYCGKSLYASFDKPFHIDHKTPLSRGGSNDISNIALSCPQCNLSKSIRTAEEFFLLLTKG